MIESIDRLLATANDDCESRELLKEKFNELRLAIMSELDYLDDKVFFLDIDDVEKISYVYQQLRELDYVLALVKQIRL
jgi:hypothetical protein